MSYISKVKLKYHLKDMGINIIESSSVLYHGTDKDFKELKPNGYGIIWLTDNPDAAKRYARRSPTKWLFSVKISPRKTVDLRDLSDPITAEYKRQYEMSSISGVNFKLPDDKWKSGKHGNYTLLERFGIDILTENHVDVAIALDASGAYDHISYAVINPKCITVIKRESF